jgi:hypothetical protein
MAGKSDFTPEEWWLLKETPLLAGAAVMVAADSGVAGTLHEMVANATSLVNAAKLFPNNALIRDLVTPDDSATFKPTPVETSDPNQKARDERVEADALDKCKTVADLLDRKSDPQQAQEYKQWVMAIGGDVASAAEEGGVLGFGKKRVSEPEAKLLVELAAALRYAPYTPPSD